MAKKSLYKIDADSVLIAVLLLFSGDPVTRFMGKYAALLTFIIIFVIGYPKLKKDFFVFALSVVFSLLFIFVSQQMVLGFVTWLGSFNFINTFLLGGIIIYLLAERFAYKFFIVVSYVSMISLFFFFFFNLLNLHPAGLQFGEQRWTYVIYTYVEQHHFRNCGMFWEPAAFAGILTMCLALNLKELPTLWKEHKFKLAAIVMAVITTESTSGYIVFFLICMYYLVFFVKDKTIAFTVLPALLAIGIIAYTSVDFLQHKVEHQTEATATLDKGEYSNTRFGSLIFDLGYIKKHPFVGNGFSEVTRYADDPELIQLVQSGANLANANGFSNFMACLGIPFMFFYLLLCFTAISKYDSKVAIITFLVILLSLFSEQWLNFALFTGIIFFKPNRIRYRKSRVRPGKRYSNMPAVT